MWRRLLSPDLDVDDLCPPLTLGEVTDQPVPVVTAAVSGGVGKPRPSAAG